MQMVIIWEPRLLYEAPEADDKGHTCTYSALRRRYPRLNRYIARRGSYRRSPFEHCNFCIDGEVFLDHTVMGQLPDPVNLSDMTITSVAFSNPDLVWLPIEEPLFIDGRRNPKRGAFGLRGRPDQLPRPSSPE